MQVNLADIELIKKWRKSPLAFVKDVWGLEPQKRDEPFIKGKHLTWQQVEILEAVGKAMTGQGLKRISVASGHGIGKSAAIAILILWFLWCFLDSQIPCTAPTAEQMYDVLWKEVAKWLKMMPQQMQDQYEWSTTYIRMKERPETWFARAKTARKEAPEALAGVHADWVMFLIDEASGVPEEIFNTAEGALTSPNILVIMISNATRLIGYFYDSHHKDKHNWQTLQFSSIDSPIVDQDFVDRIIEKHGLDSDEYKIRVLGQFPNEESMDEKGFVPVFTQEEIKFAQKSDWVGLPKLGVDPSGEGQDTTEWCIRDPFKAQIVATERESNPKTIAEKTITLMTMASIKDQDTSIDNFGVGANVAQEIALTPFQYRVNSVNVGDKPKDEIYLNRKAEAYFAAKAWFRAGGSLVEDSDGHKLKTELLKIKFKRNLKGTIQIMSKEEMKKQGIESPNKAEAFMLTFVDRPDIKKPAQTYYPSNLNRNPNSQINSGAKKEAQTFYPNLKR